MKQMIGKDGVLEVHSSPIGNPCPKQAELRILGKEHKEAAGALVRGLAAHAALERISGPIKYDGDGGPEAMFAAVAKAAFDETIEKVRSEGRNPTPAVLSNEEKTVKEIARMLASYAERIMPFVDELVGVELPVSMTVKIDGEPVRFESHIDKVFIGKDPLEGDDAIVVLDWKWHGSTPSPPYLARSLQLGLYHVAVEDGAVVVDGFPWVDRPNLPVRTYWVHLPYLLPYQRAQDVNEDGEIVRYKKGDARPLFRTLGRASVTNRKALLDAFGDKVRDIRAGRWRPNPTPDGCRHCNSKFACPAWAAYN